MSTNDREQTTLRLPLELMERLRRQAQEMGISINACIILCLEAGLRAVLTACFWVILCAARNRLKASESCMTIPPISMRCYRRSGMSERPQR